MGDQDLRGMIRTLRVQLGRWLDRGLEIDAADIYEIADAFARITFAASSRGLDEAAQFCIGTSERIDQFYRAGSMPIAILSLTRVCFLDLEAYLDNPMNAVTKDDMSRHLSDFRWGAWLDPPSNDDVRKQAL